jgi:hypothetical protein
MRVTQRYAIQPPVEFLDVHVDFDNDLYLDPSAIRNGTDPTSKAAHQCLLTFFEEVIRLRLSTSPADQAEGRALLDNLHEPNENRLGQTANGIQGKAIAGGIADELWDKLRGAAVQEKVLTRLEDAHVHLANVGNDLISDLATRVVYHHLVAFTHKMQSKYPAMHADDQDHDVKVFDEATKRWADATVRLPTMHGHALLLIPRGWVRPHLLMYPTQFFNRFAKKTVQDERSTTDEKGKRHGPSMKALDEEFRGKHRDLNVKQSIKYKNDPNEENRRDLVQEYRTLVDADFDELTEDDAKQRTLRPGEGD